MTKKYKATALWQEVSSGACFLKITRGINVYVHIGGVAPAEDTEDVLNITKSEELNYGGTEKVFIKNKNHYDTDVVVVN